MRSFSSAVIVLAILTIAVGQPASADILVSNFGDGKVRRFTDAGGATIPDPFLTVGGGGTEALACLTLNGKPVFFISNNSSTIAVYDQTSGQFLNNLVTLTGGASIAGMALSLDGKVLYAADGHRIAAVDTTTGSVVASVSMASAHDVIVGPDGSVYASAFPAQAGVLKFSPTLTNQTQFIAPGDNGLTRAAGMAFNATGTRFFVSQFSNSPSFVNEYAVSNSGTAGFVSPSISLPAGSAPLGLALGPDGNIYSANFNANTVGKIDLANNNAVSTHIANAGPNPKYVFFTEDCKTVSNSFIEICKSSSITDPVTGTFTFTATSGSFTSSPIGVPVGLCSGPIAVPSGAIKVTEAATTGTGVNAITAYGFNATTMLEENRLASFDLANRVATVNVPAGGGLAAETVVEFTNFRVPTGVIEVCKDAAPGTTLNGTFSFAVSGAANNPYTIPAGACSGPILVQAGSVTISETPRAGFQLIDVSANPLDRIVSIDIPRGSAVVNVPAGNVSTETVVRFVNGPSGEGMGQLKICKVAGPGVSLGQNFVITANGASYTVPAGPASQGGFCIVDGTFPIGTQVTVQEAPPFPYGVLGISVNPPGRSAGAPVVSNGNGQATVTIGSGFTEVTFTNIGSTPSAQLKVCKIAGSGVAVGTNFGFSVLSATAPGSIQIVTVPAGPAEQGGYCVIAGAFQPGTKTTVTELPASGYAVTGIAVNGTAVGSGTPTASVTVENGMNNVAFTNGRSAGGVNGTALRLVYVVDYVLVGREPAGGKRSYLTYRASVLNSGPALDMLTATLTSADPSRLEVVAGRDTVTFVPLPANSQVTSDGTFTVVADDAAPMDVSQLKWTLRAKQPAGRRRAVR
jgi:streptogramin lyase